MIFEKKRINLWPVNKELIAFQILILATTIFLTYSYCSMSGMMGDKYRIDLLSVIIGLANIATAAAFVFALFQFTQSIKQKRQLAIADEAKRQINNMIVVLDGLDTGIKTNIENINKIMVLLSNIGNSFDELFSAMDEDIHKAIIRMNWQDMHYNHFRHKMIELDPYSMLLNLSPMDSEFLAVIYSEANARLSKKIEEEAIFPELEKNYLAMQILNNEYVAEIVKPKIDAFAPYGFIRYYLDLSKMNDLFLGLIIKINPRSHAPLVSALLEEYKYFENYSKSFTE